MPKRSRKPSDINRLATSIVEEATRESPSATDDGKNPHAVALGRIGGQKGGKARARKLTASQRSEQARKAARKRWDRT